MPLTLPVHRDPGSRRVHYGVLAMVMATVMFSTMNLSIRVIGQDLDPFIIAFFRNLFGFFFIAPIILRAGPMVVFRTRLPLLHLLRALMNTVAVLMFFTALTIAPLAEVTVIAFTAPLFATLLAIPLFGERVTLIHFGALFLGFAGTLFVVQPGFAEIGLGQWLVLVSAVIWAAILLLIKKLASQDTPLAIAGYQTILMTPLTLIAALFVWRWPSGEEWLHLGLIGLAGILAQYLLSVALKYAPTGLVMPFDFLKLVWAALFGSWLLAEFPSWNIWIGGGVIIAATTWLAVRQVSTKPGN